MSYIHARLNDETDQDIVEWLDAQENKTQAVKDAIRAAMNSTHGGPAPVDLDLGAIRAVIETALDERLAGLTVAQGGTKTQEDQELADKLDAMF